MIEILDKYRSFVLQNLDDIFSGLKPNIESLYEPIYYSLEGGKKMRPVSVLMAADVFDGDLNIALYPALAVEIFHNFTLLHDDVMDNSPVRRNRPTVHAKWNINQAILSGDAMLILAYQKIMLLPERLYPAAFSLLNKTGVEVCEGQQMDLEFEDTFDISLADYMKMIKLKTGVLLAASLAMGAISADASKEDVDNLYQYGLNLGIAFQIQDDYFDTFGNFEIFGKKIGNDIITNKKTYLFLKAIELASDEDKEKLMSLYTTKNIDEEQKILEVKNIFKKLKVDEIAQKEIEEYYKKSLEYYEKIKGARPEKKQILYDFANYVLKRKN